jgi:hypothetical protein
MSGPLQLPTSNLGGWKVQMHNTLMAQYSLRTN